MMKVLIDTWGWISLYNKRERKHEEVKNWYRSFRKKHGIIYTTDYVLDETFTLLFRRTPSDLAAEAMTTIDEAIDKGYLVLERITPDRFEEIETILTEDDHFTYLEGGFQQTQLNENKVHK